MPESDPKTLSSQSVAGETPAPDSQATVAPHTTGSGRRGSADMPEVFGRYRILKQLGKGGMGAVYLAQDTQLERQVALKVPHFSSDDGPEVLERFYREARAAATLHHPNICPIFDVGAIDGTHYLTMAYIEGKPLNDFIRGDKGVPAAQAAALLRKVALALDEAHRHGIVHRDLKPANIMINQRKEPVIMDFGLARRADKQEARITKSGAVVGTPAYMSPEQVNGKEAGPPSDLYSLGVILYEMLTGKLPFDGPMMAVLSQILLDQPKPPSEHRPDLDKSVEAICLKAMAKDPKDRYATMAEFAAALAQFLRGVAGSGGATVTPPTQTQAKSPAPTPKPAPELKKTGAIRAVGASTTKAPVMDEIAAEEEKAASRPKKRKAKTKSLWQRPWPYVGIGGAVLFVLAIVFLSGVIFRVQTKYGVVVLNISEPGAQVFVDDELKITLTSPSDKEPIKIEVPEGKHVMKIVKGGFVTETKEFTLRPGTPQEIRVTLRPEVVIAGKKVDPPPGKDKDKEPAPIEKGWTPLFNGKDLTGWKTHPGQPGNWQVRDGLLVGRGPDPSHLFTERGDYKKFHLRAEAKLNQDGNSGIFFRCGYGLDFQSKGKQRYPSGYEAQMVHAHPSPMANLTGSLIGNTAPVQVKEELVKADEWYLHEVIAEGGRIIIKVNGKTTADVADDDSAFASGHVALQVMNPTSTVVHFKKIEIKESPAEASPVADGWTPWFTTADLSDWGGLMQHWRVAKSQLIGSSEPGGLKKNTYLVSKKRYKDFELKFQVRLSGAEANSGVQIRSDYADKPNFVLTGPQVDMGGIYWGSLWNEGLKGGGMMQAGPKDIEQRIKTDDFNDFYIKCAGNSVLIKVNGETTVAGNFPTMPADGYLGWQIHSRGPMTVTFRNVLFRDLTTAVVSPSPGEKTPAGYIALFNGKDLTGWQTHPEAPGNWKVENGNLVGRGPGVSHLFTERNDYTDFHFFVECRINAKGNSGQEFRVREMKSGIPNCYEAQIDSGSHGNKTGSLYVLAGTGKQLDGAYIKEVLVPPDTWFTQEVIAQGNRIIIKVNDKVVTDFVDKNNTYRQGFLALQVFDPPTVVEFRKVLVKEIKGASAVEPAADFVSLFNGKDLTSWIVDSGNPKGWRVENGALVADGVAAGQGWLLTESSYKDFLLRFEYKTAAQGNSGVTFRATPKAKHAEIQILDDKNANAPPNMRTGSLWKHAIDQPAKLKPLGQWNSMEIQVKDRNLRVSVNGAETVRTHFDRFAGELPALNNPAGRIGLQNWGGGEVRFRFIEVKDLAATPQS